jgi:hypothetical protein
MDSASATQSQVFCHLGLSSQIATKAGIASRRKCESPDPLSNDFFKVPISTSACAMLIITMRLRIHLLTYSQGNNTVKKVGSRDIIAP